MAEERHLVDLGMAIDADSNMTRGGYPPFCPVTLDANMERDKVTFYQTSRSGPPTQGLDAPADEHKDVEQERLMDRRMYMQATQGHVDDFTLQHSKILCQVSPQDNTCLHIAASFGHHYLAKEIVQKCSDLIKKQNSKGDTALHIAARRRDLSFIKIVMDSCPSGSGTSPCPSGSGTSPCPSGSGGPSPCPSGSGASPCPSGSGGPSPCPSGSGASPCPSGSGASTCPSGSGASLDVEKAGRDLSFIKIVMDSCPSGSGGPSPCPSGSGASTCPSGSGASPDVEKAEPSLLRIVNKEKNTVLHEALIHHCKEEEVMTVLIEADPQEAYYPNKEGKSPLYLAAEAHYFLVVQAIGKSEVEDGEAKPAVHGAIMGKNKEMLKKILAMNLANQKDKDGSTPLHIAASIGYLEGVQILLDQSNLDPYEKDSDGCCPIHVASMRGHVDIVKALLQFSPDSKELLNKYGDNFLHVAAACGKDNIVNFVLKEEGLENLINEKGSYGNTALHLATMNGRAKVVNYLTWDKRVDVNLVNDEGQTAYDIAVSVEHPSFHQRLTWIALKSAGARPAGNSKVPPSTHSKSLNMAEYKDRVNTLLLVSTLVATVTFAAGFTMPGGFNSSDPNAGMATLLMRNMLHMFVICITIAMYTSILAAITLIWAQLGDLNLMVTALRFALPFLGLALTAMSLGFMAGVYLVVDNLHWLAIVVLIIGIICLVSLLVPFLLLFLPSESTNCILRYISYYPFLILTWASKSPEIKRKD